MTIGRNKQGVIYWTDYIDGKRVKRESKVWKTQREAREHHRKFIDQLNKKEITVHSLKFDDLVDKYIEHISLSHRQSTVKASENILKNTVGKHFNEVRISKINPRMIRAFQKHLIEKNYSTSYLDELQASLNKLLSFGVKFRYLDRNPFDLVPMIKKQVYEPKKEMTILTKDEFDAFISTIENQVYIALFSVLYWCGLRIGELMALSIENFNQRTNTIHVFKNYDHKNRIITATKTNFDRRVSVPDACAKELEKLFESYAESSGGELIKSAPIFSYDGIIPKGTLDRRKNQYIKRAQDQGLDVPYFTFHELRHTHVSTLINLGMEAKYISDRLGHSVEMVNNTYSHLFPERKDILLEKLNDFSKNT